MATFSRLDAVRAARPPLRAGDMIEIEVPWTAGLPSPHRSGTLGEHFTVEQCTILCETIEQARQADEPQQCRLVDLFGDAWTADVTPGGDEQAGLVRWKRVRRPRQPK